jgi:hypothetical protein
VPVGELTWKCPELDREMATVVTEKLDGGVGRDGQAVMNGDYDAPG